MKKMGNLELEVFEDSFTCANLVYDYKPYVDVNIKIENILLTSFPKEDLTLTLIGSGECENCKNRNHYCNGYSKIAQKKCKNYYEMSWSLRVEFKNTLHLLKNYRYEVSCIISMKEPSIESLYFHSVQIRRSNIMSINQGPFTNKTFQEGRWKIHIMVRRLDNNSNKENLSLIPLFSNLIIGHNFGDISIKVGEKTYHAHREILSANSPVFECMFSNDMTENRKKEVIINDFEIEVVENMLIFLYTNDPRHSDKISIPLYEIAHKYQIQKLADKCVENISLNINSETFVSILRFAVLYDLCKLQNGVTAYIDHNISECVKRNDYQSFLVDHMDRENVVAILKLCHRYPIILDEVKLNIHQFIKENIKHIFKDKEFIDLFRSHPDIMREVFTFIHED